MLRTSKPTSTQERFILYLGHHDSRPNHIEPCFKFYYVEFLDVGHFTNAEEIIEGTFIWCEV
ncbi:MAG: hypothetical protein ACXADY_21635 [Candidatus Hodarchaeales archaeon]